MTHNGEDTIDNLFRSLPEAVGSIRFKTLLIDNSSSDRTVCLAKRQSASVHDIISLKKNIGVAAAYNLGLKEARARNIKWMFVLDQDSECASSCLCIMLNAANDLVKKYIQVGAIFPTVRSKKFPKIIHHPCKWKNSRLLPVIANGVTHAEISVDSSITSGALYNTEALESISGFREEYFIDFVDHECHLRMKFQGWSMWWVPEAELFHNLGCIQKMVDDRLWVEHKPFRYYYMARNMTEGYFRLGGLKSLFYFWKQTWTHARLLRKHSSNSSQCSRYLLKGILHALKNKNGPLSPDH